MPDIDAAMALKLAAGLLHGQAEPTRAKPANSGKFSDTFFIASDGAEEYVLRIAPPDSVRQLFYEYRMMRQEPGLHVRIQAETNVRVPTILACDFSREWIDRDYLLMNRLPGVPLSECAAALTREQQSAVLRRLGADVARLHRVHADAYGYLGPHAPMPPQENWHDAFAIMWARMIDDIVACGMYGDEERALAMRLWEKYRDAFDRAVPAALCHMDLWVANVLVEDGRYSALFDFDRACFGDPENDFAVAEYCGLTTEAFWTGYGARPEATDDYWIRRWFYLLYEHQKYIVISVSSCRNDPPGAKRYASECLTSMAAFEATGEPRL
jgi:aminoglycoside phosphotransferase (APT) family kinase protein